MKLKKIINSISSKTSLDNPIDNVLSWHYSENGNRYVQTAEYVGRYNQTKGEPYKKMFKLICNGKAYTEAPDVVNGDELTWLIADESKKSDFAITRGYFKKLL